MRKIIVSELLALDGVAEAPDKILTDRDDAVMDTTCPGSSTRRMSSSAGAATTSGCGSGTDAEALHRLRRTGLPVTSPAVAHLVWRSWT
jgi:hypothetical protein